MAGRKALPEWCEYVIDPGVDRMKPGLYQWTIDGADIYIGKYTHSRRPEREYALNVERLLAGKPYHNKGKDFRAIHYALAKAVQEGRRIELRLLANKDSATILACENELIRLHGTLNRTGSRATKPKS